MGTQNMRSRYRIPHNLIKYYPDYLKKAGYYCCNFKKTDYNIGGRPDSACWDNPKTLNWDELKAHQPFFQVINCGASHESQAKLHLDKTRHSPDDVNLHRYHPDLKTIRKNYARYLDCVENMDRFFAKQLKALEKAGLADNTIVIYNSDHGGVLPRSKRFLFDSGIHSPLVIRIPEKFRHLWPAEKPGTKIYRLVSFLDMPKTWIAIAGGTPPEQMQGRVFLGPKQEPEPKYVYAFRGRMDERIDNQRAVRSKRYLYIKNYMPYVPWGQKLEYMWEMPAYQAWSDWFKAGRTDRVTGRFFTIKKFDELYDTEKDPDNINNLINNPEYKNILKDMRLALRSWQEDIHDAGLIPECEVAQRTWGNKTTIYEMVRNPELYNLPAYLDLADVALEKNAANLQELSAALDSKDSAIRYWGLIGILLIENVPDAVLGKVGKLLSDKSDMIKVTAAYVMVSHGYHKEEAFSGVKTILERKSNARLYALNVVDWMGTDAKILAPVISAIRSGNQNVIKMQRALLEKFGVELPARLKKRH
jgi:hypothetical protein